MEKNEDVSKYVDLLDIEKLWWIDNIFGFHIDINLFVIWLLLQ